LPWLRLRAKRGAAVTVVAGITTVNPPDEVRLIKALSAQEMAQAVAEETGKATVFIGAAAVADYRPTKKVAQKIKKTENSLTLVLERTPDILSQVASSRRPGLLVIGFAAETENVLANAEAKLVNKNLDAIVANDVTRSDSGFDSRTNAITIIARGNGKPIEYPALSKTEAANRILDAIVKLREPA
jgi:phosphopantothenoylcysteine decarboxylase/phosphopantothenate--cysteine ligase